MSFLLSNLYLIIMTSPLVLFNFNTNSDLSSWQVVDDVVMGGRSRSSFYLTDPGHGVFSGKVSLANNGGFSSVRYRFKPLRVGDYFKLVLQVRGDGNRYQVRVKSGTGERHSYIAYFETSGDWETVEVMFAEMRPSFRGMALNIPPYPAVTLEEIGFLVGNKMAQSFRLELKEIVLK